MGLGGTRETVRQLYDAYERRDFDRVASYIHPDIDWVIYAPVSIFPFAGPRRGRAAGLEAMAGIASAFLLESYKQEILLVEGELHSARDQPHFAFPCCQFPALSG